jgi:CRP/FNR family transcriptional regulator, cyclic AMP receptor protein
MTSFKARFKIVENKKCPLYELGDDLYLTDKALIPPSGKPVCLILAREMTELLFSLISQPNDKIDTSKLFSCSGCSGLIKFQRDLTDPENKKTTVKSLADIIGQDATLPPQIADGIKTIPIFQAMKMANLAKILPSFTYKKFLAGSEIFRKGEEGGYVVIIISGQVAVFDGDLAIAMLRKGEIIGEMSQLTSQPVCATVKAVENTEVLCIGGDDLKIMMEDNPSVYKYFLRLFTDRLTKSNAARLHEVASAMSGTLDEMPQVELFQIFHMNAKTGVLQLDLPQGEATISFREGCIINARYDGLTSEEAIYKIIAEKKGGRFKFNAGLSPQEMKSAEIGDFMKLLMDGIRKVDEESSQGESDEN